MNRQDRRLSKKEVKKNTQIINKLTPEQAKLLDMIVNQRTNEHINDFNKLVDRNMTAALINYGVKYEDIEGIQKDMSSLFEEDSKKCKQLEKERLDLAKIDLEVREAVREVLKNFTIKKLAIEELTFKFPKLSKSMIVNAYAQVEIEVKKELYKEIEKLAEHSNAEQTIKTLMKKFGLINDIASKYYYCWKTEYMAEKETVVTKATTQELEKNADKIIEKAKEMQCKANTTEINKSEGKEMKKLLVLEETVIKNIKVAGENGTYKADTNKGVELSNDGMVISFNNEQELDQWVTEVKQVFKMVM